jgi:hypothetical protein
MTCDPTLVAAVRTVPSGTYVDLLHPDPDDIHLEDIAHHLAGINRWTGASRYTVAEHCVYVSCLAPPARARWSLLHDAAEFVLGDVSGPLKSVLRGVSDLPDCVRAELRAELSPALWEFLSVAIPGYKALQSRWDNAIAVRFGVEPLDVKQWDREALLAERRDILGLDGVPWIEDGAGYVAVSTPVLPLCDPAAAERLFLGRAWELGIHE